MRRRLNAMPPSISEELWLLVDKKKIELSLLSLLYPSRTEYLDALFRVSQLAVNIRPTELTKIRDAYSRRQRVQTFSLKRYLAIMPIRKVLEKPEDWQWRGILYVSRYYPVETVDTIKVSSRHVTGYEWLLQFTRIDLALTAPPALKFTAVHCTIFAVASAPWMHLNGCQIKYDVWANNLPIHLSPVNKLRLKSSIS
ncbi:hypothetical protein TNCV_510811 [Trichonephila clavipes]|nr:hypothetical protein TNCV_510811 [Trichonephila clavipes]